MGEDYRAPQVGSLRRQKYVHPYARMHYILQEFPPASHAMADADLRMCPGRKASDRCTVVRKVLGVAVVDFVFF